MLFRAAVLLCCLALPAAAQEAKFASYDAMRAEMDSLVRDRDITALMLRFGARDEMTVEQLDSLDARVKALFPLDFQNAALIRRDQYENGFAQELIAYWTGEAYLYVYVLYHNTGAGTVAINFRFNTDFDKLNTLF